MLFAQARWGPCSGTRGRRKKDVAAVLDSAPSRKRRSFESRSRSGSRRRSRSRSEKKRKEIRLCLLSRSPSFSLLLSLPLFTLSSSPSFFSFSSSPHQVVCGKRRRGGGHLLLLLLFSGGGEEEEEDEVEVSRVEQEKKKSNAFRDRKLFSSIRRILTSAFAVSRIVATPGRARAFLTHGSERRPESAIVRFLMQPIKRVRRKIFSACFFLLLSLFHFSIISLSLCC